MLFDANIIENNSTDIKNHKKFQKMIAKTQNLRRVKLKIIIETCNAFFNLNFLNFGKMVLILINWNLLKRK
jgi:hypothetical protein